MSFPRLLRKLAGLLAPIALAAVGAATASAQAPAPTTLPAPQQACLIPTTAPKMGIVPASLAASPGTPVPVESAPAVGAAPGGCASGMCGLAGGCGAAGGCIPGCEPCKKWFCPKIDFCIPKPPKICFKCCCPKPVCNPCEPDPTGNYGYVPTCWRPWLAPVNYSHCPVPSPAQVMPFAVSAYDTAPEAALIPPGVDKPLPLPQPPTR